MKHFNLVLVIALAGISVTAIGCTGTENAGNSEPAAEDTAAPAAGAVEEALTPAANTNDEASSGDEAEERPRFIAPMRGIADIAHLRPETKVESGDVVTRITLQNRATGAIAGLKVEEFWWDKAGNPLPGDAQRVAQPLMPGQVITIELRVPRDNRMSQNQYKFTHANGEINATLVPELPDPETEEAGGEETQS